MTHREPVRASLSLLILSLAAIGTGCQDRDPPVGSPDLSPVAVRAQPMLSCPAPTADCNDEPADDCEARLDVDADHCGTCDTVCAHAPNASAAACIDGACVIDSCAVSVESAATDHDYLHGTDVSFVFESPGASRVRVYFESFRTEASYDVARVLHEDGSLVATYDGDLGSFWSAWVAGSALTVNFTNGGSVASYGFDITAMQGCTGSACQQGRGDCDGVLTNGCETGLGNDPANCGSCGRSCDDLPHTTITCSNFACTIAACEAGWEDCDGNAANGCESFGDTDVGNCGGCGNACVVANGQALCTAGVCGSAGCAPGWEDCNADLADGCETSIEGDLNNCGACGTVCSAFPQTNGPACVGGLCSADSNCATSNEEISSPHPYADSYDNTWIISRPGAARMRVLFAALSTEPCCDEVTLSDGNGVVAARYAGELTHVWSEWVEGPEVQVRFVTDGSVVDHGFDITSVETCGSACELGWGDCDNLITTGCEVPTVSDVANCGACGNACEYANADESCVAGVCDVGACEAGFDDCDADPDNGCEAHLDSNALHCGGCGVACAPPNAIAQCAGGLCGMLGCEPGWEDCNGSGADGCETRIDDDLANCGSCGDVCEVPPHANGALCVAGQCMADEACQVGPETIASPHPYPPSLNETWPIVRPGAARMRLHFVEINTESCCDIITVHDASGVEVASYAGDATDVWSDWVTGSSMEVRFVTDGSVAAHGFDIDQVEECGTGCEDGWQDCDGVASNGCETPVTDDANNCGACGVSCDVPGTDALCVAGACVVGDCTPGYADCDAAPDNGCEVELAIAVTHCGACGNDCGDAVSVAHGRTGCAGGNCGLVCDAGFGDCNDYVVDGCEVDLRTNTANCGACSEICGELDHATSSCAGGSCVIGECAWEAHSLASEHPYANGFNDFWEINRPGAQQMRVFFSDFSLQDGADYLFLFDASDELATQITGTQTPFWSPWLSGDRLRLHLVTDLTTTDYGFTVDGLETCDDGCQVGWDDCDVDASNGCETFLADSHEHCGACRARCGTFEVCRDSTCVPGDGGAGGSGEGGGTGEGGAGDGGAGDGGGGAGGGNNAAGSGASCAATSPLPLVWLTLVGLLGLRRRRRG